MEESWILPLRVNILQKDPLFRITVMGNEPGAGKKFLYLAWITKNGYFALFSLQSTTCYLCQNMPNLVMYRLYYRP